MLEKSSNNNTYEYKNNGHFISTNNQENYIKVKPSNA